MPITTNGILALAYIYNDWPSARWNYPLAIGSHESNPAGLGAAVVLTYSFPSAKPGYSMQPGFLAFRDYQVTAAVDAMQRMEEVARVDFRPAAAGTVGEFTFAMSSGHVNNSGGKAFIPAYGEAVDLQGFIVDVASSPDSGDVWLNREIPWTSAQFEPGNYGFFTLLHEIGHGLGLKHPFEGPNILDATLDDQSITLMSYTDAPRSLIYDPVANQATTLYPTTPMVYDILALQHLYGANMATRSGSSIYAWDDKEELLETIWDGGGTDRIDCGTQTLACRINLAEGAYSSIGLRQTDAEIYEALGVPSGLTFGVPLYNGLNNLAIAFGAKIENASGGSAADQIKGNALANALNGRAGSDLLSGLGGKDNLLGGAGNDTLAGGAGADRLSGGSNSDIFDFNGISESGLTSTTRDVIVDFVRGLDRVDLSGIDAKAGISGNQVFTFIGSNAFSGAGQVRFAGGVLSGSTDGDTAAEFSIQLSGLTSLGASDLIL